MDLNLSECREIFNLCKDLSIDFKETLENIANDEIDFEVENYRFINQDDIDEIQEEELKSDPYIVGCFNAWFLADILQTSTEAIEKIQEADGYEGLGEMIVNNSDYLTELQENYASSDGYGHHFNHYDGNMEEVNEYFVFRTN